MNIVETYRHDLPPHTVLANMTLAELNILFDFHEAMRAHAWYDAEMVSHDFYEDNIETILAYTTELRCDECGAK